VTDLVARPDTTVFSQALGITGIGNSLASGDEYTLLVPTDQALLRYLDDAGLILEELTTVDTDELYDLIASHIVVGEALPLEEFVIGDSYVTLNNNKVLTLRSSIEPIAVEADLVGCNAQVHIVSYVVRPQTLTDGSETPATAPSPPVVEAPAPVVEAPAPVVEAPAPVVEAPVTVPSPPVVEAPAPVVEAPVTVPSPPVVEAPAPEADLPASTAASVEPAPESDLIPLAPVVGSPSPIGASQQSEGDLIPLQPPVAIPVPAPSPPLTPQPAPPSCAQSIADVLYSGALGDDINVSGSAANYVGLANTLDSISTNEAYTIFVPTDAAWGRSGTDWDAVARDDPAKLLAVILNHIIPGQSLQVSDFQVGSTYPTLNENKLLKLDGPLDPVVVGTVTVCNTVIHKISVVIVPAFVGPLPAASGAASAASSAASASQQATAASSGTGSSNQASSSVDIVDVSIGDNNFSSGSASWNGNSFSGSSGNWGDSSWSSGDWNWGGFSGSANQIVIG
jgi:uncharacterized surface protein with fasciclin (FAS1) repeats